MSSSTSISAGSLVSTSRAKVSEPEETDTIIIRERNPKKQFIQRKKVLPSCCLGSSWQVRVGVVVVVMLSKWPEILEREDEVLIVGLGFLETPRALLVLVFMSIYGIGSSVCQNYSDLELSSFRGKKAFTERMKPTTYAATKKTS